MTDDESIRSGTREDYWLLRRIIITLIKKQKGDLLSLRTTHRFLRQHGFKVKSVLIREVFSSLQLAKEDESNRSLAERYRNPDSFQ